MPTTQPEKPTTVEISELRRCKTVDHLLALIRDHGRDWVLFAHPDDTFHTEMALIALKNQYLQYIQGFRLEVTQTLKKGEEAIIARELGSQTLLPNLAARKRAQR